MNKLINRKHAIFTVPGKSESWIFVMLNGIKYNHTNQRRCFFEDKPFTGFAYYNKQNNKVFKIFKFIDGIIIEETISLQKPQSNPLAKALYE